jgi:hypothetical protein
VRPLAGYLLLDGVFAQRSFQIVLQLCKMGKSEREKKTKKKT